MPNLYGITKRIITKRISAGVLAPVLAPVLVLALAACDTGGGMLSGFPGTKAPKTTRLVGGKIQVAGPAGFCVDRSSKVGGGGAGFVALGACASISNNPNDAMPPVRAILTVSATRLSDVGLGIPAQLSDFLGRAEGRAALAQSGVADHLTLMRKETDGSAVIMQVRDVSPNRSPALNNEAWRGMFVAKGHLISLSVSALNTYPFADATGEKILRAFVDVMRQTNPEATAPAGENATMMGALAEVFR